MKHDDAQNEYGRIDVRRFGARGDGQTDDTAAIREAIAALPPRGGVLFFPPGHYLTDTIVAPEYTTLMGHAAWTYAHGGFGDQTKASGTILSPVRDDMPYLIDARGKRGTRFVGLHLHGQKKGKEMHGIFTSNSDSGEWGSPDKPAGEQNLVIDDCRIAYFSGSGFSGYRAWVWCIQHSIFFGNGLDGIDGFSCYDAFVIDNQLSGNGRHGFSVDSSVTITGNRIEHNGQAGIEVISPHYPQHLQITGNLFCTNHAPAIEIPGGLPGGDFRTFTDPCYVGRKNWDGYPGGHARAIAITGNTFRCSGYDFKEPGDRSCHVRFVGMDGLTFTGNALNNAEAGDGAPGYGMVLERLTDSVILGNSMCRGARLELIHDKGGHRNLSLANNPGSLCPKKGEKV